MTISRLFFATLLAAALPAAAQEDFQFPNPFRSAGIAATCDNWEAQRQAADPQAMQMIAGVWEGQSMIPGTPGIMPDTPIQVRAMNSPDGTFRVDRYGCFTMQSVPGMPPLGESCSQSMLYGEWVAHFAQDGSIAVVTLSSGTGFTGEPIPMSCGIGFWRTDGQTLMDQAGNRMVRTGG